MPSTFANQRKSLLESAICISLRGLGIFTALARLLSGKNCPYEKRLNVVLILDRRGDPKGISRYSSC
jgi:hypothetical protein